MSISEEVLARVKGWREYVEAKLGFRNHWYPVRFSSDLAEGQTTTLKILGEAILMKRIKGEVFAIRDRCLHRGVPFSKKLECFTHDTVTCWYHGYTYRITNGELINILAVPDSKLIGRKKLKTFPAQEAKGVIFLFIGDNDREPPPLSHDVPPTFLDEDMDVRGIWQEVKSNWRLGCENGFDTVHIFIHKDTVLRREREMNFPLGHISGNKPIETVEAAEGPKGVLDPFADHIPVWEGTIDGQVVVKGIRQPAGSEAAKRPSASVGASIWLPGVLKVDSFPMPELTQFEWYVPIDEGKHLYFQTLGKRVHTEEERTGWVHQFNSKLITAALHGFNDDDIWAREATEPFYANDLGWIDEVLCEPDRMIIAWRKLASRWGGAIQTQGHLR